MEIITFSVPDWDKFRELILEEIKSLRNQKERQFMKSAEARKLLGGISAAKLQSLRISGHLPAIDADGLWLYDVSDIMSFINKNKTGGEEVSSI